MKSTSIDQSRPHMKKPGSPRVFRGSKKRLAKLRMRDNMSLEIWCFAVLLALFLCIAATWLIRHPGARHTHHRSTTNSTGADADSANVPQ